jgi:peroxiredoxin
VQLQESLQSFQDAGLGVVAVTYDSPEAQARFVASRGLEYPMLSDVDAATVNALGIRNVEYEPGHSAYGIPYPGIYVLDGDLVIREKIFVEGYETRVGADDVLQIARRALNLEQ